MDYGFRGLRMEFFWVEGLSFAIRGYDNNICLLPRDWYELQDANKRQEQRYQ